MTDYRNDLDVDVDRRCERTTLTRKQVESWLEAAEESLARPQPPARARAQVSLRFLTDDRDRRIAELARELLAQWH